VSGGRTIAEDTAAWRDLLALAAPGRAGRALVDRLAREFRRRSGIDSFALYSAAGAERRYQDGGEGFPAAASAAGPEDGRLDLPGGALLYRPATISSSDLDDQVLLTLLCALQAADLGGQVKRHSFAANLRGVELQALYDVGLAIARTLDLDQLGEEVLLRAVSLLDARVGALYLRDDGAYHLSRTFGGEAPERVRRDDPALAALLERRPAAGNPILPGTQFQLGVPIEADGKDLGLLVVADKESRRGVGPFAEADARMLGLFANQAAIALENASLHRQALEKERLERELDLAAEIQRQLLPKSLPRVEGFEFAGWSRPARHVGGDYYDVRQAEDGAVHLVLGDVSGKGMPAALLVATLHSALRLLLAARPFDADLVARLNRHIAEASASNKFITMTAARLEPVSASVSYVNAGHNPPLLVRRGGSVEELPPGGMPLGIFCGAEYQLAEVGLDPGDLLCIFSDGITECETPDAEEYGPDRLTDLLRGFADRPLEEIVRHIDEAVVRFAAGGPQGDDQTVVLLRRS
jgi:phosphoserine phosphatase RsbU/P